MTSTSADQVNWPKELDDLVVWVNDRRAESNDPSECPPSLLECCTFWGLEGKENFLRDFYNSRELAIITVLQNPTSTLPMFARRNCIVVRAS